MALAPTDTEHPDVLIEAKAIAAGGGLDYLEAIGELSLVVDCLFDGPGNPAYIGASRTAEDVFYEHPPHGTIRIFSRQFWGSGGASVVTVVCVKGNRPVLMSIVAVDLALRGAGYPVGLTYQQADAMALKLARQRCKNI